MSRTTQTVSNPKVNAQIQLKRHYQRLSPAETDALVEAVANLIVGYLKKSKKDLAQESVPGGEKETADERAL